MKTKYKLYRLASLLTIGYCLITNVANAQNIYTIAGSGPCCGSGGSYSGDGGQATAARLEAAFSVAIDNAGNLLIADNTNHRIRKVTTAGIISTFAGNGTAGYTGDGGQATAAEINNPIGISLDILGNVYIADGTNNCIRKINTAGIILTVAGTGTAGFSGDGGQATAAELNTPHGVSFDAEGNMYIMDQGNQRIRLVNSSGIISTIAGNGTAGYSGDGGQATLAEINYASWICFDMTGNLYIADSNNERIRKINTTGIISTVAGNGTQGYSGDGGQATAAEMSNPAGIIADASGSLYIPESQSYRIRKISSAGIINTIAGNGTMGYTGDGGNATAAELSLPAGVTIDAAGNVYVADDLNYRVRVITVPLTVVASTNTICAGGTASITANGGAMSYKWSPSTGLSSNTGSLVVASPTVTTTYTLISSLYNVPTGTTTIKITVNNPTTATVNPVGCSSVTVNATTYTATGTYTQNLTNVKGCDSTLTINATINPIPTLSFTASSTCLGTAVNITNTSTNQASIATWSWTFGDGSTNNTATPPAHTYTTADCYSVVLTATNTSGCVGSFNTTAYVHANPTATFNAFEACLGTPSDFIDMSSVSNPSCLNDQITSWQWAFGDGVTATFTTGTVPDTVKHTYASCGAYNITMTVTTNSGCSNTIALTGDSVFCLPVVSAPPSFSICPGTTVPLQTFTSTVANGGPASAAWLALSTRTGVPAIDSTNGGFTTVPAYNSKSQNLSCGTLVDTIEAVAVSRVGCQGNHTFYTVTLYPTPYLHHMPHDSACANQTIGIPSFTACPVNSTITWTNSNTGIGLAPVGTGNIGPFTGTNTSNVLNTAQINVVPSANGCMGNDSSFTITVKPIPVMTVTGATVCPGNNVPSPMINTNPAAGVNYSWTVANYTNIGMPASGTGTPIAYIAPSNTTLTNQIGIVTYTPVLSGCVGLTATDTINLKPTPFMQPIANQYVCPNSMTSPVSFATFPPSVNSTYNWSYNAGGVPTTGNTNLFPGIGPTINSGSTTISMVVSVEPTLNGCQGPDSTFTLFVYPMPTTSVTGGMASIPLTAIASPANYQWINCTDNKTPVVGATNQTFALGQENYYYAVIITQNNCTDTSSCYVVNYEGIPTYSNNNNAVNIYPNPNNGMFSIVSSANHDVQCTVYDVTGKLVLSQTIQNGKADIDAGALAEGVYNISLISTEGIVNKRLVITR